MKSSTTANAKRTPRKRAPNKKVQASKKDTAPKNKLTVEKEGKKIPPPSLPEGWPVSTSNPFLSGTTASTTTASNANISVKPLSLTPINNKDKKPYSNEFSTEGVQLGLAPGSMLQKCTGEDIQMSKNSDARPNFAIGRGRFLFILPGMLSLRPPASPMSAIVPLKSSNGIKDKCADGGGDYETAIDMETIKLSKCNDATSKQELPSGKFKTPPSSTVADIAENVPSSLPLPSSTLQSLGKVKNLKTSHPSLVIPLPNGQTLTFKGRKLPCSSRFLVLTCRSSGKVLCRDVFQEIVAFGDVTLDPYLDTQAVAAEGNTDEKDTMNKTENNCNENVDVDKTTNKCEEKQDNESKDFLQSKSQRNTFHHYGGSERTVDGGRCLKLPKANRRNAGGTSARKKTTNHLHVAAISLSPPSKKTALSSSRKQEKLSVGARRKLDISDGDDDSSIDGDKDDADNINVNVNNSTKRKRKNDNSEEDSDTINDTDDDEEDYISNARGEMSTVSQLPRKRSARLSSVTKEVKYSFQSDDDSDTDSVEEERSKSYIELEDSVIEENDADSSTSECHNLDITSTSKVTSRPKRQSSGCRNTSSARCREKSKEINSIYSTVDLTITDGVSKRTDSAKNKTMNNIVDDNDDKDDSDNDVVVIQETLTPTRKTQSRNASSTRSRKKSKTNSVSSTVDLTIADGVSSKKSDNAKNKTMNNFVDDNGDEDDSDNDVVVIQETLTPTRKTPRTRLKSPGSAEFSYRRRRKSTTSSLAAAIKSKPRCLADGLETGFVDDEFQFLNK